jgi:UDP-galactopyranose mutase
MYDYLVIGAGLYGIVFSRCVAELGKKVLIIEKRKHIGGNCYTDKREGINVHVYGPHIFHTNNKKIWDYVNKFTNFINYEHRVKVNFKNQIYSFPINLTTLNQVWGVLTPNEAKDKILQCRLDIDKPKNMEEWILSKVGKELYEIFIQGYTIKQWNKDPKDLPCSIIKRLPIRLNYDDRYFNDLYQGVPIDGYTAMFENMLDHKNITIQTNVDFFENKKIKKNAKYTVFTGEIDQYYDYTYGRLEYRSSHFETKILKGNFQGAPVINYTDGAVPYTRVVEHKHIEKKQSEKTVVTWEYPKNYNIGDIPYYPIKNKKNNLLYKKYYKLNDKKTIFGGRLGTYQYYDMHQIIAQAISTANKHVIT